MPAAPSNKPRNSKPPPEMTRIVFEHEGVNRAELVIDEEARFVDIRSDLGDIRISERKDLVDLGAVSKLARQMRHVFLRETREYLEKTFAPFFGIDRIIKAMDREAATAKRHAEKRRLEELEQRVRELEGQKL